MELARGQLLTRISLRGGWVWVGVGDLDGGEPEPLFNTGDGPAGWVTVRNFVQALERSGLASSKERPVQIGEPASPDAWLIA